MIERTVEELTPIIGTRPACRAVGASPATVYRRRRPPKLRPRRPRLTPERALTPPEREAVLEVLHSERFVDISPEGTYATLLDEGTYLCSTRTMYRILAAHHGGVRERRDQLTHPAYAKPELLAERPNELWSWDVSKLKGPAKWTYYYLYVILDVFSRYVVGWTVQHRETAQLAKVLIEQATEQQQITPKILTLDADRGAPQRAKPVAFLLADLGIMKTHSRPYTSSDNPLLGVELQDPEVPARVPRPVPLDRARPPPLPSVLRLVQPCTPPLRDRPHDPRRRPLRPGAHAARRPLARPRRRLPATPGAVRPQAARTTRAADRRLDQQAKGGHRRSLISNLLLFPGVIRVVMGRGRRG
jgi:putative transposase